MRALGTEAILCTHWADGAKGAVDLARAVKCDDRGQAGGLRAALHDHVSLAGKIETIAREIYRAAAVSIPPPSPRSG
jgi:formate--tetrahydrofolate ligase